MDFELLPLIALIAGGVLLYGAVANKNPVEVIKAALTGQDLSKVPPLQGPDATSTGPGAIPGNQVPGTPGADGDARTDPKGFDPNRDSVIPRLPGERSSGPGVITYKVPFNPGGNFI